MSEDAVGLYPVKVQLRYANMPGAATLDLDLIVNTVSRRVTGSGQVTQALPPPFGTTIIRNVAGSIAATGAADDQHFVFLNGDAVAPFGPAQPGQVQEPFVAALVVDGGWNGVGAYEYGRHVVLDCKVKNVTDA